VNWFLLYRGSEFAEVLAVESVVFRRTGKLHTWGKSERIECADAIAALEAAKQACADFERDGFVATRAWKFERDSFDFELFATELSEAVKKAFTRLRAQQLELNAFALMTDDSAMTLVAAAHHFPSIADAKDEVLWNPNEWSVWDKDAPGDFDVAYRLILSQSRDELTRVEYGEYRDGFEEMSVRVLEQLKREALFGAAEREFVLLHDVTDSEGPTEALVSRLNSETLGARYRGWLASWKL